MKKVIKKKLEETKQHAFEKKVLQREKAKGAPRVGEFYKENDILLEDISAVILHSSQVRLLSRRNIVWHLKLHIQEQKKTYLERSTG